MSLDCISTTGALDVTGARCYRHNLIMFACFAISDNVLTMDCTRLAVKMADYCDSSILSELRTAS